MDSDADRAEAARAEADAIAAACARALASSGLDTEAVERLSTYATRHLPLAERAEGSPFIPPLYATRVARHLGVEPGLAVDFAAAGCLFFAAADLADDCADGDVRRTVGLDVNDTCHLLFAQQHRVLTLDAPAEVRCALARLFAEAGQEMAVGQAADLSGTDAVDAPDPEAIAWGKSGGELAAFFAGPALLAGTAAAPWRQFGRAFGALVQVLTDYFDLFLDPTSDDWEAAKPTVPLRHGMDHPTHGAAVRLLLAGDRAGADRKARGLWHLVQAGVGPRFAAVCARLTGIMRTQEAALDHPPVLATIRDEIESWCAGVIDALVEYAADPAPQVIALADEVAAARQAALAWLAADPTLDEATEVHRHGLFDAPRVAGTLFGQALAIDALRAEPVDLTAARAAVFETADPDGWRYYPGHPVLPTDVDCIGVMMQIADTPARRQHPAFAQGEALMRRADNQDPDGLIYTWLADGRRHTRAGIDAVWAGEVCLGAMANAIVGLWRWGGAATRAWARRLTVPLAARLAADPASVFYPPEVVDYMVSRCLLEVADRAVPGVQQALDAAARRAAARRTASGRMGGVLATALGAWILARLDRLPRPAEVRRALVDAQAADGGYPADPLYRTVPHPVTQWYGSRVVTTAYVLQTLRLTEAR